jgi:hypothetical protein
MSNLCQDEKAKLYDALEAWRDILFRKIITKQIVVPVNHKQDHAWFWSKVLANHLDATR